MYGSSLSNEKDIVEHVSWMGRTRVPRLPDRSSWTSSWAVVRLPSCSVRLDESRILLCPIRSLLGLGSRVHRRPAKVLC
jgi:hypothetical protein